MANDRSRQIVVTVVLVLVTLLVYLQVKDHDFLPYDDDRYVTENWPVRNGVTPSTLVWALTSSHASNWHPLTWSSHMIDVELFGFNAGAHHLVNLFFHLLNTVLVFHLFTRLTGAFWQSAFVAALFALHPLHVESVAWIAERKDVVSMLFFLLTILAYARYAERPSKKLFVPVTILFVLGLMSKPMVVTLPFVLLLLDFWPFRRFEAADPSSVGTWERPAPNAWKSRGQLLWALVWEKFWLFACALVSSNITFQAQQHGGTVSDLDSTPLISRIANATVAYTGYLRKTFWPSNLAPFYPYSEFVQWLEVAFSVGILVGVTLLVLILGREFRYLPVGWFWYLGMLVPVIGLVQVGAQSMADRYTYIPLIGIFVIIAWGFSDLLSRARWRIQALSGSAAVAILLCAILTWQQVGYWKNGITLFSHTLAVTEGNWVAHHNLGWSLHDAGRYAEAREQFERTLELHPTLAVAHFNMGRVARDEGKLDEARSHYEDALGLDPMFELGHVEIGLLHARQGEVHEARAYFDSVLALWPEFEKVRLELARLLIEMGEFDAAAQHVQTIIETNPFQLDAREVLDRMRSQEISQ